MIHGMMLVKNESNRYLVDVLMQLKLLCDRIVISDDKSDDDTVEICRKFTKEVYINDESLWGVDEKKARQKLWDLTIKNAKHGDFIICLDADEMFDDKHIDYIKYLLNTVQGVDGIGFRLFDMWNDTHYRFDRYWQANLHYWCMCIRYDDRNYIWHDKKLHCGRFPANASQRMLPTLIPIKHMGWSKKEDRIKKYNRYMYIDPNGKNGILEQYKSILDENPNLIKFGGESNE